ncbi:MAG: ATP-binding cassette domain-containing protein, partial [Ignisphaera sp.]
MQNNEIVLTTVNLTKHFGGLIALDNISVSVKRNTLTLLIGPNGAGKTTLINTCIGVLKPDNGRILF